MGPMAGLDGCGISGSNRDSISGPSRSYRVHENKVHLLKLNIFYMHSEQCKVRNVSLHKGNFKTYNTPFTFLCG